MRSCPLLRRVECCDRDELGVAVVRVLYKECLRACAAETGDDPGDEAKGDEFRGKNGLFFGLEGVFGLNNDGITIEAADILSG